MERVAQSEVRPIRSYIQKSVAPAREQEILEEFSRHINIGIGTMSPGQVEEYERKADEIMKQARLRPSESSSVRKMDLPTAFLLLVLAELL